MEDVLTQGLSKAQIESLVKSQSKFEDNIVAREFVPYILLWRVKGRKITAKYAGKIVVTEKNKINILHVVLSTGVSTYCHPQDNTQHEAISTGVFSGQELLVDVQLVEPNRNADDSPFTAEQLNASYAGNPNCEAIIKNYLEAVVNGDTRIIATNILPIT